MYRFYPNIQFTFETPNGNGDLLVPYKLYPNIQFTLEIPNDNGDLIFLDININVDGNR